MNWVSFYWMFYIQYCFFPSGGGVADMLQRLSLMKDFIEDVNFMCVSFSVKHPQIFCELWMSLSSTISNIYTYPFNSQLVLKKISRKSWSEAKRSKGTFICGPLLSKWMGLFHSWLDYFSIEVWAFIQNLNFFIFSILVSICYNF